jgi:hypothetical protein
MKRSFKQWSMAPDRRSQHPQPQFVGAREFLCPLARNPNFRFTRLVTTFYNGPRFVGYLYATLVATRQDRGRLADWRGDVGTA